MILIVYDRKLKPVLHSPCCITPFQALNASSHIVEFLWSVNLGKPELTGDMVHAAWCIVHGAWCMVTVCLQVQTSNLLKPEPLMNKELKHVKCMK